MYSEKRDTMSKLIKRIWRNEGIRGLYRGLLPNIIKGNNLYLILIWDDLEVWNDLYSYFDINNECVPDYFVKSSFSPFILQR